MLAYYSLLFLPVLVAIASSLLYARRNYRIPILLAAAAAFVVLSAVLLAYGYSAAVALVSGFSAAMIAVSAFFYIHDNNIFYPMVALALVYMALGVVVLGSPAQSLAASVGAGLVSGVAFRAYFVRKGSKQKNGRKSVEIRRDIIQIVLGAVVIAVFLALGRDYGTYAVVALAMLGYIFNSTFILSDTFPGRIMRKLERKKAIMGEGALFMGAGSLLVLGLVGPISYIIFGLSAIFFADSAATIIGINAGRVKLPYNKDKSIAGSLAYFVVVSSIGFALVGAVGIAIGAVLTLVESINVSLDDNASTAMVFIVLVRLILL